MSATVIVTTGSTNLREAWVRQLAAPDQTPKNATALALELARPGARVWIRDLSVHLADFPVHQDTVVIAVGEAGSAPFAEAQADAEQHASITFCLTYEQAATMLRQFVGPACELAEKRTVQRVLTEQRQSSPERATAGTGGSYTLSTIGELDFIEEALENAQNRPAIIGIFRRGIRRRLKASKVSLFVLNGEFFEEEAEGWKCPSTHELPLWLQHHAAIVHPEAIAGIEEPLTAGRVRQMLESWNARLLIPLQDQSNLVGWVCLGPRSDARRYSNIDHEEALALASLLARNLSLNRTIYELKLAAENVSRTSVNGPKFHTLRAGVPIPADWEIEIREVLGQAKKESKRVDREIGSMRVSAGPLGNGDFWAYSDSDGGASERNARKLEIERFNIIRDYGLILAHEQSNALTAFSTYLQHQKNLPQVAGQIDMVRFSKVVEAEMDRLKALPHNMDMVYEMARHPTEEFDVRRLLQFAAKEVDAVMDIGDEPILLWGHEGALRQAVLWLCKEIKESRDNTRTWPDAKLRLRLKERQRGGPENTCLIFISYPGLQLKQLRTEKADVSEYITTTVFLAREIIRFHPGTIEIGESIDGPELYISLRSRRVAGQVAHGNPVESSHSSLARSTV